MSRAVKRLPSEERVRYQEEWSSHLGGLPNTAARVVASLGFYMAAHEICVEMFADKQARARDILDKASFRLKEKKSGLAATKSSIADARGIRRLEEQLPAIETLESRVPDLESWPVERALALKRAVHALATFVRGLVSARNLAFSNIEKLIDKSNARIDQVERLLRNASTAHECLGRQGFSREAMDEAQTILNELERLEILLEEDDDHEEDRPLWKQTQNIVKAIHDAASSRIVSRGLTA